MFTTHLATRTPARPEKGFAARSLYEHAPVNVGIVDGASREAIATTRVRTVSRPLGTARLLRCARECGAIYATRIVRANFMAQRNRVDWCSFNGLEQPPNKAYQ